jgi:inosine-uridine nucleoside N-ribohydrolase
LSGRELVSRKVSELVIMGGGYPSGRSWNFWGSDPALAAHVIHAWEGRIVFAGDDVGKHVLTGGPLMAKGPKTDPVRMAYIYYSYLTARSSWDPLTVLYAMEGLGELFQFGNEYGYNHIEADGANRWVWDKNVRNQFFLRLKVDNATAAAEVDRLLLHGADSAVNPPVRSKPRPPEREEL